MAARLSVGVPPMNEQSLLSRWTLESEDPKEFAALNLAIEQAKLQQGYRPGQSAPEMELKARQRDLGNRQTRYIDEQKAKGRDAFVNGSVGGPRTAEVDFASHFPYINVSRNFRGFQDTGTPHQSTKRTPVDAAKNQADFDAIVNAAKADDARAVSEGKTAARIKGQAAKEQAARNRNIWPEDLAYRSGGTMTRGGQTFDVPNGMGSDRRFDDTALHGPMVVGSVGRRAPASATQSIAPAEEPVADGDLPNDDMRGMPSASDSQFEPGVSEETGETGADDEQREQPTPAGYQYFRTDAPEFIDPNLQHGGGNTFTARSAADRALNFDSLTGNPRSEALGNTGPIRTQSAIGSIYDQPTTELRGVARKQVFDALAPVFTDRRKPQTLVAPATMPVAHRAY